MQNEQIPDFAITASSYRYNDGKANNGRLHFLRTSDRVGGWVAKWNDKSNPYFQVHFGSWRKVTRVAIQGRQDFDQWIKSFSLSYGYDPMSFQIYKEQGAKKVSKRMTDKILFELLLSSHIKLLVTERRGGLASKPSLDCWQSVFLSIFSLKENGTRHGHGTHEKKNRLHPLLMFLRTFTLVKIISLTNRSFSLPRNNKK